MKYRLTGAAILIVLVVLLVPEILRGPVDANRLPGQPATSGNANSSSYTIDLSDQSRAGTAPAAPGSAPPEAIAASEPAQPVSTPGPDTAAPAETAQRTGAAVEPPRIPQSAGEKIGFAFQVGSFASRDNAERVAAELHKTGLPVYLSPTNSGSRRLYRVRVGPVASRDGATQLGKRVVAAGRSGQVVPTP
ncbi:MAG: SPOR domain-containing protein [Steroidobacteraceae bacterium]